MNSTTIRTKYGVPVFALCAFLWASDARAGFVGTMTIYGTESGTFEGQSFTNALVTFTATYDTSQVTKMGGTLDQFGRVTPIHWSAPSLAGSVTVAGVGSGGFLGSGTVETYSAEDYLGGNSIPGGFFMDYAGGVTGLFFFDGCGGSHVDRDLTHSIAATQLLYNGPPPTSPYTIQTSAGDLTITSRITIDAWTAQVDVVPEPSSLTLLGIGAAALLAYGSLRRRQAKPAAPGA